jgi:hypothetical protein
MSVHVEPLGRQQYFLPLPLVAEQVAGAQQSLLPAQYAVSPAGSQQRPLWQPPLPPMEQQSRFDVQVAPFGSVQRGGTPSLQQLSPPHQ